MAPSEPGRCFLKKQSLWNQFGCLPSWKADYMFHEHEKEIKYNEMTSFKKLRTKKEQKIMEKDEIKNILTSYLYHDSQSK